MELREIMARRGAPAAGLLVSLTSRCPLHCAHCSSASTADGPEPADAHLRRFIASFGPSDRPDVTFFTGGEPLLRPALLGELAVAARAAGSAPAVLTGAFFARGGRIPDRIRQSLDALDHVSISLDAFHEREVPRSDVFAVLRQLLSHERAVSLHVVGAGADDPYLADVVPAVRRAFGRHVPLLVSRIQAVGRAAAWPVAQPPDVRPEPVSPCAMATWPVVAADGLITACCNPAVVERRPVPEHLLLGDVTRDGWPRIRARLLGSGALRAIRTTGPEFVRQRFGVDGPSKGDVCTGCHALADQPALLAGAATAFGGSGGEVLDRLVAERHRREGPVVLLRRYGIPRYAAEVVP